MTKLIFTLIAALLLASMTAEAQQSQPTPPAQVQAKPLPCAKGKSPRWLHPEKLPAIHRILIQIGTATGGAIDAGEIAREATAPSPCPIPAPSMPKTQETSNKQPTLNPALAAAQTPMGNSSPTPPVKPSEAAKSLIHCNIYYPAGKGLPLFFPDPQAFATPPSPTVEEFDAVVPDTEAKTLCHELKVDPKSGKYFVAE